MSSPPGVEWGITSPLVKQQTLPCQAGLRPHSRNARCFRVKRLTTKGLAFAAFLAPVFAGVNRKKIFRGLGKMDGSNGCRGGLVDQPPDGFT